MKILIIGGAGLIGSNLASKLADLGHQVEVCDLFAGSIVYRTSKNFPTHAIDATHHNGISYILAKVNPEAIILGPGYHPKKGTNYSQFEDCRTSLDSANVLASLLTPSIKKVVLLSGSDVYGPPDSTRPLAEDRLTVPTNLRGVSEKCAEDILSYRCASLGIQYISCRLFDVYGPRVMFTPYRDRVNFIIDALLRGEQIGLAASSKKRDFIHVDDAASAVCGVMLSNFSGSINIGTGKGITLVTLCKEIGKHIQVINKPIPLPDGLSSIANVSLLKKVLPSWSPAIELFSYLPELIEFRIKEGKYYNVNNARQIIEDQRRT